MKNDRTRKEVRALVAHYSPPDYSWDAEARRVILASDVGSHTSAQQMILWPAPYRSIPILSATGDRERLRGEDLQLNQGGENLTPSEKDRLLSTTYDLSRANEHMAHWSRTFLRALFDLHMEIPQKARRETMAILRARFGDCTVEPNYAHYDPYNQANGWEDRAATLTQ